MERIRDIPPTQAAGYAPVLALIGALALVLAAALPIITYPPGANQAAALVMGETLAGGGVPYLDAWDIKPPGIHAVYAVAVRLFGPGAAVRAIDLALVTGVAACLYVIGARLVERRVGLWAMLLFGVLYFSESFWTLTQNDGVAMLPMALAAVATLWAGDLPAGRRGALLAAFCAGALSATALWFKYPFITLVVGLALYHALNRRLLRRALLYETLAYLLGGMLVGLGGMALLVRIDAYDAWIGTLAAALDYRGAEAGLLPATRGVIEQGLARVLDWWWILLPVLAWPVYGRRRREWLLPVLWTAATLGAVWMQGRGSVHHWLPLMPPLALFAADVIDRATSEIPLPGVDRVGVAALVVGVLVGLLLGTVWAPSLRFIYGTEATTAYYARFTNDDEGFHAGESDMVSRYLDANTPAEAAIIVWGFRPEVYMWSGREPASRFFYNHPLVADWGLPRWRDEFLTDMRANAPAYFIVVEDDANPTVTGHDRDSAALLDDFPALADWLRSNYYLEAQLGSFQLWRRERA